MDTEDNSSSNQPRLASNPATRALVQSPDSPEFCCPCGAFLGWKQIRLGGRRQSRSYSDLRLLGNAQSRGFAWEVNDASRITPVAEEPKKSVKKGQAPIELLPAEILGMFIYSLSHFQNPSSSHPKKVYFIKTL